MSDGVGQWLRGVADYAEAVKNAASGMDNTPINITNVGKFDALKVRINGTNNFGYLVFKEDENGLYPEFLTKEEYDEQNSNNS